MTKCKECRFYGGTIRIGTEQYALCDVDGDVIEMCVAEDENLGCDLYVKYMDDNETKRSEA